MNKTITRQVGSFRAISDSGKYFTIFISQIFHINDEFGKAPEEIPGTKSLRTSSGRPVNMIDENTYEILGDMEKIRVTKV